MRVILQSVLSRRSDRTDLCDFWTTAAVKLPSAHMQLLMSMPPCHTATPISYPSYKSYYIKEQMSSIIYLLEQIMDCSSGRPWTSLNVQTRMTVQLQSNYSANNKLSLCTQNINSIHKQHDHNLFNGAGELGRSFRNVWIVESRWKRACATHTHTPRRLILFNCAHRWGSSHTCWHSHGAV